MSTSRSPREVFGKQTVFFAMTLRHCSIFVFFVLFGLACLLSSCYSFRLSKVLPPLADRFRPIFCIPACDTKNPLEQVYYFFKPGNGERVLELSLVFKDEDQPFFLADWAYDLFRRFKYHRKKDIETLYLHFDAVSGLLKSIDFGDAYSGDQKFSKAIVKHFRSILLAAQIKQQQGRPLLFINTWNHLLAEYDTNPALSKTTYADYLCVEGSRQDAEPGRRLEKSK
jgi:hypothetical protein